MIGSYDGLKLLLLFFTLGIDKNYSYYYDTVQVVQAERKK